MLKIRKGRIRRRKEEDWEKYAMSRLIIFSLQRILVEPKQNQRGWDGHVIGILKKENA
jgi:hypothetical protein